MITNSSKRVCSKINVYSLGCALLMNDQFKI